MSQAAARRTIVEHAAALAREFAPDLTSVILTHFPDADTLDMFRPGEEDLETTTAVNRAVAAELAGQGVQVLVQKSDRASFRRWMAEREDSPENRLAWRDRGRLLRGAAALAALGLDPGPPSAPRMRRLAWRPGYRLLRAFVEEGGAEFEELAQALLAAGRDDVLDLAVQAAGEVDDEEGAEDLRAELLAMAEGAEIGPSGWAERLPVALPVALPPGALPDAAAMGAGLVASGILPDDVEIRLLAAWRSPDAIARLSPGAIRRVLVDMVAGREPADLAPAPPYSLSESGFAVLLGLQIDWSTPVWEDIAANGLPDDPEDGKRRRRGQNVRRSSAAGHGCLRGERGMRAAGAGAPLRGRGRNRRFPGRGGEQARIIEEIREFIAMARREARGEESSAARRSSATGWNSPSTRRQAASWTA